MRHIGLRVAVLVAAVLLGRPSGVRAQTPMQAPAPGGSSRSQAAPGTPVTVLRTSVRRVVLDVMVTDGLGLPVPHLQPEDFTVREEGIVQHVLSFDVHGFGAPMESLPLRRPATAAPNVFFDLPTTPEKGPLYVLLLDLVNMDNEDQMMLSQNEHSQQMFARQQLVRFVNEAPEGTRFAIFTRTDRLYLIQGFTSDKAVLAAAVDPSRNHPHLPMLYLMGQNTGRGGSHSALRVVNQLGTYLEGLPGRKNLLWFSGGFPLTFFATPDIDDSADFIRKTQDTLNLLAQDQIAIYPVDCRGVVYPDWHSLGGMTQDGAIVSAGGPGGVSVQGSKAPVGNGPSLLGASYLAEDEIARETGGRAFYSSNDVAGLLLKVTEAGASYYTLTYSPSDRDFDGRLRHISVQLAKKGYTLSYRRSYFGLPDPGEAAPDGVQNLAARALAGDDFDATDTAAGVTPAVARRLPGDRFSAIMQHGAPAAHELIFGAAVTPEGAAALATPRQMAALLTNAPELLPTHHGQQPPRPVTLQRYSLHYSVFSQQFRPGMPVQLEVAVAAYDADGHMLNSVVDEAVPGAAKGATTGPLLHVEQSLAVPPDAAFLRFAVRDAGTGRLGATEIPLPLARAEAAEMQGAPSQGMAATR